ncbi:MAG: DUF2017 family protein [Acidimicrobiia bacterium]
MSVPFERHGESIKVRLSEPERAAISGLPAVIEEAGGAGGRFEYQVHPEDPAADRRYQELVGDHLGNLRATDREAFAAAINARSLDIEQAEGLMRVIGEGRIVLAMRLGIEADGWEESASVEDPEVAMLHYLGYLQESLVEALTP